MHTAAYNYFQMGCTSIPESFNYFNGIKVPSSSAQKI